MTTAAGGQQQQQQQQPQQARGGASRESFLEHLIAQSEREYATLGSSAAGAGAGAAAEGDGERRNFSSSLFGAYGSAASAASRAGSGPRTMFDSSSEEEDEHTDQLE